MSDLVAVKVNAGLVVWHTREEFERLMHGVDMDAARLATADLEAPENQES